MIAARLGVVLLAVHALAAATIVVGQGGDYSSVRDAIAGAAAGDTIRVESGTYPGSLALDKPLILEGVGKPVIHGDEQGSIITVLADGCTIRGLILEHSGGMLVKEDSGILLHSSGNRIEENELRDVLFGIYFFASSRNIVTGNVIRGRAWLGVGERGSGPWIATTTESRRS